MTNFLATPVNWAIVFGVCATVLSTLAYLPYMLDTLRGRTQPQRASWLIWSVLATISFFSQWYEGASASLGFAGAQAGCTIMVFTLSVWRGRGHYLSRADVTVLGAAAIGLIAWFVTETAAYALSISITISLLGGVMTVTKTYKAPETETLSTWALCLIASCAALAAVGQWDPLLLAYPAYLFTLNAAILMAAALGGRVWGKTPGQTQNRAQARTRAGAIQG